MYPIIILMFSAFLVAPAAPSGVTATADSTTTISVTWNAQQVDSFYVYYKKDGDTSFTRGPSISGSSTSYTIPGLTAGTQYRIWVSATKNGIESLATEGEELNQATSKSLIAKGRNGLDCVHCCLSRDNPDTLLVRLLPLEVSADTSFKASWLSVMDCSVSCHYKAVLKSQSNVHFVLLSAGHLTDYCFSALIIKPTSPWSMAVNNRASTQLEISWSGPDGCTYIIKYRKVGQTSFTEASSGETGPTYVITGLEPATQYEIQVITVDANGVQSEPSTVKMWTG